MISRDDVPETPDWDIRLVTYVTPDAFDRLERELDEPPKANENLRRLAERVRERHEDHIIRGEN